MTTPIIVDQSDVVASLRDTDVFTTFVVSPSRETQLDPLASVDPIEFLDWLRRWRKRLVIVPTASLLPSMGTAVAAYNFFEARGGKLLLWVFGAHVIVLMLLLFILPRMRLPRNLPQRVVASCEQFRLLWQWIWISWLALYIFLFARQAYILYAHAGIPLTDDISIVLDVVGNTLNNATTVVLILLYFVMAKNTTELPDGVHRQWKLPTPQAFAVFLLLLGFEVMSRLLPNFGLNSLFPILSGLAAGLTMALIVGRFDSTFVGLPTFVVVLMYAYAIIQPVWGWFQTEQSIFFSLALTLKVLFFIVVSWFLDSGMLSYYMQSVATISEEAKMDKITFFRGRM